MAERKPLIITLLTGCDAKIIIPDVLHTGREIDRVSKLVRESLLKEIMPKLGKLPASYKFRLTHTFANVFNREVQKGQTPVKARNAGAAEVNQSIKRIYRAMGSWGFSVGALYSVDARDQIAKRAASVTKQIASKCDGQPVAGFCEIHNYLSDFGIAPDMPSEAAPVRDYEILIAKTTCYEWLRRRVERMARRIREQIAIALGYVGKDKTPYLSRWGLKEFITSLVRGEEYLNGFEIVNDETGEIMDLGQVAQASSSNPEKRVTELEIRIDGVCQYAERNDYQGYFLTMTAPSTYHPNKGRRWNGATPIESHRLLQDNWIKARALIAKEDSPIDYFGFRVVEPHKDACPHWHMLIFVKPDQAERLLSILASKFREPESGELTTKAKKKARFDVRKLKNAKHAALYVSKYIRKNITGQGKFDEPFDRETGLPLEDSSRLVVGWSRIHGIRQFQFFGVESVTVWREVRRLEFEGESELLSKLKDATGGEKGDDKTPNWYAFTKLLECNSVQLLKDKDLTTRYGEPAERIRGIIVNGVTYITRIGNWIKQRKQTANKQSGSSAPWMVVTNCNFSNKGENNYDQKRENQRTITHQSGTFGESGQNQCHAIA